MNMLRNLLRRRHGNAQAGFCDRCGQVCDQRCQDQRLADRRHQLASRLGPLTPPR